MLLKFPEETSTELFSMWGNYPEITDSLESSDFYSFSLFTEKIGRVYLIALT